MNATEHLAAAERYLADAPTQTTPDVEALHVQYAQTHFLGAIAHVLGANDEPLLEQLRDAMPAPVVLTDGQYHGLLGTTVVLPDDWEDRISDALEDNEALAVPDWLTARKVVTDLLRTWQRPEVVEATIYCGASEGATGIDCGRPDGHDDDHEGTASARQTETVGYPLTVRWPRATVQPCRCIADDPCGCPGETNIVDCLCHRDPDNPDHEATRQDLADLRAKLAAPRTEPKWNVGGPIIPQPEAAVYVHQETNHG